jgi:asparagine synthase (glutamine-hydrolysing)
MCGIVGTFGPSGASSSWLDEACVSLRHRGPDAQGIWREPPAGIAFGHTRLAILELSDSGSQPMASACGRYHIAFNGEIYNHLELRAALAEVSWRGRSDTETLLACFARWGVEKTLTQLVGMFALALFDSRDRRLVLARDRFGEKPLYCGYAGASFVFASELRALRSAPGLDTAIDREALALYMRHSCVPAPHSIYSSIRKLPAASWLELTERHIAARVPGTPHQYWSATDAATRGIREPLNLSDAEAVTELERVTGEAVKGQMIADVPLGAFLSGGIDSSAVVALMQRQSSRAVRTFAIGFTENAYDESGFARSVAQHLGTEHTEMIVSPADLLQIVPRMAQVYDEPFADSSQLPTFLVCRLAREHVKVALSGDAGDELFGGYRQYLLGPRLWSYLSLAPLAVRRALAQSLRALASGGRSWLLGGLQTLAPARLAAYATGDNLQKVADVVECPDPEQLYRRLVSYWWQQSVVLSVPASRALNAAAWPQLPDTLQQMMLHDALTYLPDDILVKVDRAAMAVSLETRIPLLDHRVFEFVWRLPTRTKMRAGQGKWLLRQLLYRYVPRVLVDRPKMGFAVPLAEWLRGPLREWAEDLLQPAGLRQQGYLDVAMVRARWEQHLCGTRSWHHDLWNVLMFQLWLANTR